MRTEVSASELPNHLGKDIILYDEESKQEKRIENIRMEKGWIRGWNKISNCYSEITTNYKLSKIFIDA
jgi:hypothetical protein